MVVTIKTEVVFKCRKDKAELECVRKKLLEAISECKNLSYIGRVVVPLEKVSHVKVDIVENPQYQKFGHDTAYELTFFFPYPYCYVKLVLDCSSFKVTVTEGDDTAYLERWE